MLLNYTGAQAKWGIAFGNQKTTTPINPLKIKQIKITAQPLEIFSKLQKQHQTTYLLESIEGPKKLAKYSFIGLDPKITIETTTGKTKIKNTSNGNTSYQTTTDPLQIIEKLLKNDEVTNNKFRFVGGAVGYISYDAVRYWEKLPENRQADLGFPDLEMGIFDDGLIFNHAQKQVFYYYRGENRLSEIESLLKQSADSTELSYHEPRVNTKKEDYENAVEKAKEYVTAGDIFQVVLSKRYQLQMKGDLIPFYEALTYD